MGSPSLRKKLVGWPAYPDSNLQKNSAEGKKIRKYLYVDIKVHLRGQPRYRMSLACAGVISASNPTSAALAREEDLALGAKHRAPREL